MTPGRDPVLELDAALDRLFAGAPIVAVEEDVHSDLIPFIEVFAGLLEIARQEPRPAFRAGLRARLVGAEIPESAGTAGLGSKVAALVAGTFLLGSAINPALARTLVNSVNETVGAEIAGVLDAVLSVGEPATDVGAPKEGPSAPSRRNTATHSLEPSTTDIATSDETVTTEVTAEAPTADVPSPRARWSAPAPAAAPSNPGPTVDSVDPAAAPVPISSAVAPTTVVVIDAPAIDAPVTIDAGPNAPADDGSPVGSGSPAALDPPAADPSTSQPPAANPPTDPGRGTGGPNGNAHTNGQANGNAGQGNEANPNGQAANGNEKGAASKLPKPDKPGTP